LRLIDDDLRPIWIARILTNPHVDPIEHPNGLKLQ
jgi:hypothetical protein